MGTFATRVAYYRHGVDPTLSYSDCSRWPRTRTLPQPVATKQELLRAICGSVLDLPKAFSVKLLTGEMLEDYRDDELVPVIDGVAYCEIWPKGARKGNSAALAGSRSCLDIHRALHMY